MNMARPGGMVVCGTGGGGGVGWGGGGVDGGGGLDEHSEARWGSNEGGEARERSDKHDEDSFFVAQ